MNFEKIATNTSLWLNFKNLTSLPENIGDYKHLEFIHLEGNQLTSLPESICNLKNLGKLDISKNQLKSLPEIIGNLENLDELDLRHNQISYLPKSFRKLKRLTKLDLSENPIKSLSNISLEVLEKMKPCTTYLTDDAKWLYHTKEFLELYHYYRKSTWDLAIEYLNDQNSLTPIEKGRLLHEAGRREIILLGHNLSVDDPIVRIITNHDIPESERKVLTNFSDPIFTKENGHIIELNLKNTRLRSLPESIGNLKSLKFLIIARNKLTILPESIGNLKSLQYLNAEGCELTFLPDTIVNLPLSTINLRNNQITDFPEDFKNLSKISIDLYGNPIKSLSNIPPESYSNLKISGDYLTNTGKKLYKDKQYEKLAKYYNKSCKMIAKKYHANPKSLTKGEMERLIHEMGKNEVEFLESQLLFDDPLLNKIMERKSFNLSNGSKLYL